MVKEHKGICPECHVGRQGVGRVSYFAWRNGLFVTIPDFPAWVCDVCGAYEYDRVALAELQAILRFHQATTRDHNQLHEDLDPEGGTRSTRTSPQS